MTREMNVAISAARIALLAIPARARLRLMLEMMSGAIPEIVEEQIAERLRMQVAMVASDPNTVRSRRMSATAQAVHLVESHPRGISTKEIAEMLGKTPPLTAVLLARAKKRGAKIENVARRWYPMGSAERGREIRR